MCFRSKYINIASLWAKSTENYWWEIKCQSNVLLRLQHGINVLYEVIILLSSLCFSDVVLYFVIVFVCLWVLFLNTSIVCFVRAGFFSYPTYYDLCTVTYHWYFNGVVFRPLASVFYNNFVIKCISLNQFKYNIFLCNMS